MDGALAETRVDQLLRSPGGCALLLKAAASGMTPAKIVEPVTALHLVSNSIGELYPWTPEHDRTVETVVREGKRHRHRNLAGALVREPGIERWWAPIDRVRQVWIEPETRGPFPDPGEFPTPAQPPNRFEIYAQHPHPWVSTSTEVDGWTSQLADLTSGFGDWHMNYPARRAHVRVASGANVYEVVSAEDWHVLVARHGVQSHPDQTPHPRDYFGQPWGPNDGLVPDWQSIAREWDGIHLTLWGYLTATQTRVTSEAGWSELWSWEGEQTTWLRWAIEDVEELPTLETLPEGHRYPLPIRLS